MVITFILLNLGVAFIFGIYLSFHFFFNRVKVGKPWRWLGGVFGGLMLGTLMALIDFLIIWPPVNVVALVVGIASMFLAVKSIINYPEKKRTQSLLTPLTQEDAVLIPVQV